MEEPERMEDSKEVRPSELSSTDTQDLTDCGSMHRANKVYIRWGPVL